MLCKLVSWVWAGGQGVTLVWGQMVWVLTLQAGGQAFLPD